MEENIADALKMAGSVLLFVIGLSIAILSFSQARGAIDAVLKYSDRESLSIEGDSRFYYLSNENNTNRYVGKETIIPAIYRAYKENYKIIFEFPDDYYIFTKEEEEKDEAGHTIRTYQKQVKTIDLEKQSIGNDLASRRFLDGIIYGRFDDTKEKFEEEFKIKLNTTNNLYDYLTSKESSHKIKESLGTYYKNDVGGTSEGVSDVNKTEKRVITYTFE